MRALVRLSAILAKLLAGTKQELDTKYPKNETVRPGEAASERVLPVAARSDPQAIFTMSPVSYQPSGGVSSTPGCSARR